MRSSHVSSGNLAVLVLAGLLCSARAAEGLAASDPADWPALSLHEFVTQVHGALRDEPVPPATRQAAASQSATRLTGLSADAQVDYADFLWLYHWAGDQLTDAQKTALAPRRTLPTEAIPSWTLGALRHVYWAQYSTGVPLDQQDAALITWLASKTQATAYQADARNVAWLVTRIPGLRGRREGAAGIPGASLAALHAYVELLLGQEETINQIAFKDVSTLFQWSQNEMSADVRAAVRARIAAPLAAAAEIKTWKLSDLRAADNAMRAAHLPRDARDTMVAQWIEANTEKLDNVRILDELAWLALRVRRMGVFSHRFSVTWTGFVKAPANGNYTFFTSPIDINMNHGRTRIEQSLRLSVGGQVVLDAKQGSWQHQSDPVSLQAGQLTPLRVELHYADSASGSRRLHGTSAILMWQSAGQPKAVVPSTALVPPAGTGVGLEAEYRVQLGDADQVSTRMEAALDHVWLREDPVIASERALLSTLEDALLTRMSEQSFLAIAESALAGSDTSDASAYELRKARSTLQLAQRLFCITNFKDR